jgi:hypothetical protein
VARRESRLPDNPEELPSATASQPRQVASGVASSSAYHAREPSKRHSRLLHRHNTGAFSAAIDIAQALVGLRAFGSLCPETRLEPASARGLESHHSLVPKAVETTGVLPVSGSSSSRVDSAMRGSSISFVTRESNARLDSCLDSFLCILERCHESKWITGQFGTQPRQRMPSRRSSR